MAEIKLVRVDYRLIHGQVVARWLKVCPVRRIVLVDDVLGNDEFMSDIYKMAVPKGTDVDIVTINKAKEVLDNTDDTVFLISKDIETCLKLVEKGVELPAINGYNINICSFWNCHLVNVTHKFVTSKYIIY